MAQEPWVPAQLRGGYTPPQLRTQASPATQTPTVGFDAELAKRKQQQRSQRIQGIITAGAPTSEPEQVKSSFSERLKQYIPNIIEDYKKGGQEILDDLAANSRGEQRNASTLLQTGGVIAKTAFSPITNAIKPFIEEGADRLSDQEWFQKFADSKAGDSIINTVQSGVSKYRDYKSQHKEGVGNVEALAEIAMLIAGEKPAQKALQESVGTVVGGTNKALRMGTELINKASKELPGVVEKGAGIIGKGSKTTEGIVGEITQASTKDIPAATRAISAMDTEGVVNFRDFATRIDNTIGELANKVDDTLSRDTKAYKPSELIVERTSPGGQTVRTDYLTRAMNDLLELYSTTGDDVARTAMEETRVKMEAVGLTRKEVNDIARQYGTEFGQKAFGKTGEPLTSVNAQLYENTRSGLKEVARQGMDDTAKNLDRQIADLYVLQKNVKKNVEKVAQLYNKIQERGVFEKIGDITGKAVDIASGGLVRSFLTRFFPSNVGLKRMNYLDIEAALSKNLQKLDKILNAKNDSDLIKAIREYDAPQFDAPQIRTPQFEQRSFIERSPVVKYLKENTPNIGLTIKNVGRKVKQIDELTKAEMVDAIAYLRSNKPYDRVMDDYIGYMIDRYGIKGRTDTKVANELEKLVEFTKTIENVPGREPKVNFVKRPQIKATDSLMAEARKYKSAEEFITAKFGKKPEYGMAHRPTWDGSPPASNLLEGDMLPKDVYTNPDFSIANGAIRRGEKSATESWNVLQKIKGKPDAEITIYRAGAENELNTGDWVTLSKEYAKQSVEGSEKVHSFRVKAKDVLFAGDDINEFGYYPKSQLTDIWREANKVTAGEK